MPKVRPVLTEESISGFVVQTVLFSLQQLVEFVDQLQEPVVIFFLLDQCAEFIHPLAFFWFHRQIRCTRGFGGSYGRGRILLR